MTRSRLHCRIAPLLAAWVTALGIFTPLAARAADLADCAERPDTRVLVADPFARDARAVWLDRASLWWPAQDAAARYRLYHAARPGIQTLPGRAVEGADGALDLRVDASPLPAPLTARFGYLGNGVRLHLDNATPGQLQSLLTAQLVVVREDADGRVLAATGTQIAAALDDLYAPATALADLGATPSTGAAPRAQLKLWAPTARAVAACLYAAPRAPAYAVADLRRDDAGAWTLRREGDLRGQYYAYLVDVVVPGVGLVRNRVTDPYSLSLSADSARSMVVRLDDAALKPRGWDATPAPRTVAAATDMVIYELHVRDFSLRDPRVRPAWRGKYLAFTEDHSHGMRHLKALAAAGLTDVHLLPIFDIASIPESGCVSPAPQGAADSDAQQAAVAAAASRDCYNWGYDPLHYTAPEGSYATDAADGARRVVELRAMVQALHRAGLRVGMDVVYNHTPASGQHPHAVLDRIVPGYYQRLSPAGVVETSTCCANTATENAMMAKLMIDSVIVWARDYGIDSFRFDLMGHQPRAVMERLQAALKEATGRDIPLIGEGWDFGEVAHGARFVQAAQMSLAGAGIGTFSDRTRDAVRGGSAGDSGEAMFAQQGWINGLGYSPNGHRAAAPGELAHAADLVRTGLAGTLRDFPLHGADGRVRPLRQLDYKGSPAGYASAPDEVVNYVENHDNHTLWDINAMRLPRDTTAAERARVQLLAAAVTAFSQGIAYYHAGLDILRSKSLDRNSYDSGDWFNTLDWTYRDNHFGVGLPPAGDNRNDWPRLAPLLADPALKPAPRDIAWMRDAFRDLLRIRASTPLFRLRDADDIVRRLRFFNTGPAQEPTVIAAHLDGRALPGARYRDVVYFINVDTQAHTIEGAMLRGKVLTLHPVHRAARAADRRARKAKVDAAQGCFVIPPRTAVVFVAR